MTSSRLLFATALVALLACAAPVAAAGHPHQRDGWNVGFGAGGGSGDGEYVASTSFTREDGITGSIRLGIPMRKTVHFAIETSGWRKSKGGDSVMLSALTGGVAWFPTGGLVVRGGVGWGVATESVKFNDGHIASNDTGFGATAGLGYEFRLTRTFALGPQIDGGWMTVEEGERGWRSVSVQANWYFIPRF